MTFTIICLGVVLLMISYWIYKFVVEDQDVGLVDYESLDDSEIDLPLASICIRNPFLGKKLTSIDVYLNATKYLKHLSGDLSDDQLENADYENLTINLNNYFVDAKVHFLNGSVVRTLPTSNSHAVTFNGFVYGDWFVKCYAYELNKIKKSGIEKINYFYNTEKLSDDFPEFLNSQRSILLAMHYPDQFLLQPDEMFTLGPSYHSYAMINEIEFLQSRKTWKRKCEVNWKVFDTLVQRKHMEIKGCKAPYHKSLDSIPGCKNELELKKYKYHLKRVRYNYYPKACNRLSKLAYRPSYLGKQTELGRWQFQVRYPESVKIIQQSKEINIHSLIGNVGGYIGLFLGIYLPLNGCLRLKLKL